MGKTLSEMPLEELWRCYPSYAGPQRKKNNRIKMESLAGIDE